MPQLLMYVREHTCGDQEVARTCLTELNVQPTEVNISREPDAAQRLLDLAGALAVPTFVVADEEGRPISAPRPLAPGERMRNTDRGSIISEPDRDGLRAFLFKHGFLNP